MVETAYPVAASGSSFFHPERLTRRDDDDRVMQQAIEKRSRRGLNRQEVTPLLEWPVARQTQAAMFIRGGHETEQQLGTGLIQGCEAQLIDQDQVVAEYGVDELANGIVGESAIEGLDQIGGDEIPHPQASLDRAIPHANQAVAFARANR
jgi:hypothetical protein